MNVRELKRFSRKVKAKTGRAFVGPTILYQDGETGKWYDFAKYPKVKKELDPRIQHPGKNHYLFSANWDNSELEAFLKQSDIKMTKPKKQRPTQNAD